MRGAGKVGVTRAKKYPHGKTQGIGRCKHRGQQRCQRQHDFHPAVRLQIHRFGKEHLLGQETVEQRHAGHGGAGHQRQRAGDGHSGHEAGKTADVAGAGFVVDDAGRHEQRGLEGGVVEDVEHSRHGGHAAIEAEQQGDQSQMADGGVGQQTLEVVLEHGRKCSNHQRDKANAADNPEPFLCA